MQPISCEFSPVRGPVPASWSCQRQSLTLTTTTALSIKNKKKKYAAAERCAASRRDDDGGGRLVDEGMVVLRRRIHETRAAERNWEPPAEWHAWEKEWYGAYDADVCRLVGALQALLLSARPGVSVGIVAALALAVPASAFVLVSHLVDASRGLFSGLPH